MSGSGAGNLTGIDPTVDQQTTGAAPDPQESAAGKYMDQQSNAVLGAQMAAEDEGSKSLGSSLSDLVTKGAPATAMAVVNSFYNTGVEAANFFGADAQKAGIADEFGPDSDTTAYYQQHAGVIEGTALAAGSLIPGLGATKLLKMAQLGKFGQTMSVATGLFSGIRDEAIASAAADTVGNATGQSLFGLTNVNKVKSVLAGVADNALQGATYQVATLATMHASPITDNNTMGDNISDIWDAAKSFGMVGGLIDGASSIYKIKSAVRNLDMSTKSAEAFGSLGGGNLTPGDRIVKLYDTLDNIPEQNTPLGKVKASITNNTTNRLVQQELVSAAGGDVEVAGAMRKFMDAGRLAGAIGPDDIQNNFGQLTQIGRYTDTGVLSTPSDVFYVPSKVEPGLVPTIGHEDLMSRISSPDLNTQLSKALSLSSPTRLPTIGRATDTGILPNISTPGATPFNLYQGAVDAYKKGVDIFLDANGGTHINPTSTVFKEVPRPGQSRVLSLAEKKEYLTGSGNLPVGSKPLNAVGLTLDVTNGKIFGEDVLPVVGDIAKPVLRPNGLMVGDLHFPNSPGADLMDTAKTPLQANARYVWAAMRGVKDADSISSTDLPMLEQLYREKLAGFTHENLTDTFTDGSEIPTTPDEMLQHITDTKQSLYSDLLGQGKDADEIGHFLNAPTKGLTKNFNTMDPSELISGWNTYLQTGQQESANIRHLRLAYDIGTTKDSEGNLLRGMQATNYRVKLAQDANTTQVSNWLAKTVGANDPSGAKAQQYLSALQFTKGAGDADIAGAGSSFLTNANADYGTLAAQSQRIGKATSDLTTMRHSIVSDTLASSLNKLRQNPQAAAEFGNFWGVLRSTGENFSFLSDSDAAANGLPKNTVALEGALTKDPKTGIMQFNKSYLPPGFEDGGGTTPNLLKSYYTLGDPTMDTLRANQSLLNPRNQLRADWWTAQGVPKEPYPTDRIYLPPINGEKYPFMAYVKQRDGYALGQSGASVITAKSAGELQSKIAQLSPEYDAFTKDDIADFKKAQGEFQFNRNFMNNKANTDLARRGILNNVVPETRAENIAQELAEWHNRQETLMVRDHVELHNAATFDQLTAMGARFDQTGTSRFGAITPFMQRSATNPYNSYIRTALGISPKDNYPLWGLAQEKLESFGNTAFNMVRDAFGATQKGLIPVEQAAKVSEKFGLGNPYGTAVDQMSKAYYGGLANQLPDPNILRKFIATANTTLGATVIRLDTFQQLIHAVTLPIMTALEHSSATQDLKNLMSVEVPGTAGATTSALQVPGFSRSLFTAIKNYFTDDGTLQTLYHSTGMSRDELQIHRQMIDNLSMPLGKLSSSGWAQKIDGATQAAEKLTGSKFTNSFIHFIASDVGRQIGEATGQAGQELKDTIGTFSNRVLGNISAGQRAGIFSGPVGQAVGLFQSYQWNMMQQLFRHIGDGDVKALAMAAGLQSSIFGLSSLPGFSALNSTIAGYAGNTGGQDLYSAVNSILPPKVADYLLYGSLSGLTGLSLYSRGDLNPRRATILPVNPLQSPSVSAGIRVYSMLSQLEQNVTQKGGNIPASLLLAAEHNGLSRPLSGLAQLVQGFSTAPNGNLVATTDGTTSGLSELSGISTMSRILGAKPLEEAVAMDAMYRSNALMVKDNARLSELGASVKTAMYGNQSVDQSQVQDFMGSYVAAGGNQTNFNKWFLTQFRNANVAEVNRTYNNLSNPRSQALQETMGGQPLPDFRTQGSTSTATTDQSDGSSGDQQQ